MLDDALFTARGLQDDDQGSASSTGGMASFESDVSCRGRAACWSGLCCMVASTTCN